MVVDHRHRFMFCYIPKAACTSWKNTSCQLIKEGVNKTTQQLIDDRTSKDWDSDQIQKSFVFDKCGLKRLNVLDKATQLEVLTNYTKIMAVRDPIDRIISLYYNKLYVPPDNPTASCQFCYNWGKQIRKSKKKATALEMSTGRGVSLKEFVAYTTDNKYKNDHYKEQHRICKPCNIKYYYILKRETMKEDAVEIISRVFNSSLPFFLANATNKTIRVVPSYASSKSRLLKRYQRDFDMFGYKWHDS